jgi:hypothetical protein
MHKQPEPPAIGTEQSPSGNKSDAEKLKQHLDLRRSSSEQTAGMYRYFPICSRKEHLDNVRRVDECTRSEEERRQQEDVLAQIDKEKSIREKNRQRKRRQREREKAKVRGHGTFHFANN